ncbi:hypothetical protein LWI29_024362 [Acer saccharum]|uniref:Uncharacterized protein n=1 Tax=Acer saccharum TaxID=4024 RepID=A0AA39TUT1_ACESA|nr:hypothetical protein LWI29_024362 [Acer saccharum]
MDEKIEQPISDQRENMDQQQLQLHSPRRRRKGGMITMPFIIANEAFEKVASYGLVSNMILYLMREYHIGAAKGSNILFVWSAATNFMPTLGAIIGDSYLVEQSTGLPVEQSIGPPVEQSTCLSPDLQQFFDIPRATKLYASRLEFKAMRESWTEITLRKSKSGWLPWLEVTELRIPQISISPYTECVFKNIMAFELFYYPTDTKLCHYANMMDRLINTIEDVDLLVEKGIIINRLSDAELVVKMFNGICKDITLTPPYTEVIRQMKAHYRQP